MKIIGMIGGMSWESSIEYYRIINQSINDRLGGVHSAKCVMYSVDFAEIEELQRRGNWQEATRQMIEAAQRVEKSGADFLVICTNTMHKMADDVQNNLRIPILHIADATAQVIKSQKIKKIGLLGTKFTMEEDFYRGRLEKKHGLDVSVPNPADREIIHRVIYDELVKGQINSASKAAYIRIMDDLISQGAEGIILGCTEIGLLIQDADSRVPLFDTTKIHALAAVDLALTD